MERLGDAIREVQHRLGLLEMVDTSHLQHRMTDLEEELELERRRRVFGPEDQAAIWGVDASPPQVPDPDRFGVMRAITADPYFLDGGVSAGFQPDVVVLVGDADDDLPGSLWQQFDQSLQEAMTAHAAGFWPASIAWECKQCGYPRNAVAVPRCSACDSARIDATLLVEWAEPVGGWTDDDAPTRNT